MITFKNVSFAYGEKPILRAVSASFPLGKAYAFIGPSGCGKTTLLRLVAGLEKPQTGTVCVPLNCQTAVVFQENRLLPWLTVRKNIRLVMPIPNDSLVEQCLSAVELTAEAEQYPASLSGGMQRRVALARALAYGGDILLLDEPFTGLDDALKERIAKKFCERFAGKTIFLVTHSSEEATLLGAAILPLSAPLEGQLLAPDEHLE